MQGENYASHQDSSFQKRFQQTILSDVIDHEPGPLKLGGRADLPLLIILLAIRQQLKEPSFLEVIDSCLVSICFLKISFPSILQKIDIAETSQ